MAIQRYIVVSGQLYPPPVTELQAEAPAPTPLQLVELEWGKMFALPHQIFSFPPWPL